MDPDNMALRSYLSAILIMAISWPLSPAEAKRAPKPKKNKEKIELIKISAVSGQEIQVRRAYAMARDCALLEPNRIVVIIPPTGGTLSEKFLDSYPSFPRDNPRHSCNKTKISSNYAIYKAKDNFRGTDRFRFAIVYYDGTSSQFDVEATVWR